MVEIKKITDSCQFCAFAQYEDHSQVGCLASYLDKFKKLGSDVVVPAYNEAGDFFVINGYKCPAHRSWQTPDLERLKSELVMPIDVFVMAGRSHTEDNIFSLVEQFEKQTVLPRQIQVILFDNIYEDGGYVVRAVVPSSLMRRFDGFKNNVSVVESVIKGSRGEVLDRNLIGNDSSYYIPVTGYFDRETVLDNRFIEKINSLVFDQFKNFIMIKKGDDNYPVINTKLHHALGGNRDGRSIEEKMELLNAEQKAITENAQSGKTYILEGDELWKAPE